MNEEKQDKVKAMENPIACKMRLSRQEWDNETHLMVRIDLRRESLPLMLTAMLGQDMSGCLQ